MTERPWYLYVVECAGGTLYTGISIDVERRVREHNAGRGARYTAGRRPVILRAVWRFAGRRAAMQAERAFKQKTHTEKERLVTAAAQLGGGEWQAPRQSPAGCVSGEAPRLPLRPDRTAQPPAQKGDGEPSP